MKELISYIKLEDWSEEAAAAEILKLAASNMSGLLYDFPENMPLYKDSGLWQMRSEDMEEVIVQQGVNESDADFIARCKSAQPASN